MRWRFAIDVGGTFTDCVGIDPAGTVHTHKLLSRDHDGQPAPIAALRALLDLGVDQALPSVDVRLGTTRGTNALLERTGARTLFVTTQGFADVLRIGTQDRPRLFDLAIKKHDVLFEHVIEIDERIAADGRVLKAPNPAVVREQLRTAKGSGFESVAVCLLHSFMHPSHERVVETLAREVGFDEISRSSHVVPLEKIVVRGDTTVMNAYLNPVLRGYVATLRHWLTDDSRLQIMTSAGGLVDADHFLGKDSILSGPAGGVVGVAQAATAAGFAKALGFDMGGTSTDVSRFAGQHEFQFETQKAGVRVAAPMMAIETVAAGGGSICRFDGTKLVVGPESAGANPGPACYGHGGPLTVTDLNVYLGKIVADRFPFTLDKPATEARLQQLADDVGQGHDLGELALGLLRIANANMLRAMRSISIARGYDPKDHVLVCFGGAAAQHACAIADELSMDSILVHPHAGILSAWGVGMADVRRIAERSLHMPLTAATEQDLHDVFALLADDARAQTLDEGVPENDLLPATRTLELRYVGLTATLSLRQPEDGNWAAAYEQQHELRFGYRHQDRAIEAVVARVEVVGRTPTLATTTPRSGTMPKPFAQQPVRFGQTPTDTDLFDRAELPLDAEILGPAIICDTASTIVVDPGWRATVIERGELLLSRSQPRAQSSVATGIEVDAIALEIFHNQFGAIAEQMGIVLRKTASSVNVKERLDFSCALFTSTGDLVVNAPHIPVHLGAMSESIRCLLADAGDMQPGDVFVSNDPYRGGSHLPDVTVMTPVFVDGHDGPQFFVASRAHHADIGGIVPGSMPPFSTRLGDEGVVLGNLRLISAGNSHVDELERVLRAGPTPSRAVADNLADIAAQVAANQRGITRLREMIAHFSLPVVHAYTRHIQAAAEKRMRLALAALPDGRHALTDHLDDGSPICVAITVDDDQATVDFTGTGPVLAGNLNANPAIVSAAVLYCFRCLLAEDIPLNSGVLAPLRVIIPDGCLLAPRANATHADSPAVVGGNVETSQRIVDVILGALGIAAASQGTMNNLAFGDGTSGYYETICGGSGATEHAPGAHAVHTHMTNTRLTDPEVLERRYQVRVHQFAIRTHSGGRGRQPGGDGTVREIEFLQPMTVSILSERRGPYAPFGLCGGEPGALGNNSIVRNGQTATRLDAKTEIQVEVGDRIIIKTPGGGGFGHVNDAKK